MKSIPRPSAAMIVAVLALVVAASGTAVAATGLISGDKLIKKHSLSGNRLRNHTITGNQVNLSKLGKVPSAHNADQATNATNATNAANATNAGHATSADKIGKLDYRSAPLLVPGSSTDTRATGTVSCPAGTFVTGGGVTSPDETTVLTDYVVDSYPTADRTGWKVTMENETASPITETVWAVCVAASTTG